MENHRKLDNPKAMASDPKQTDDPKQTNQETGAWHIVKRPSGQCDILNQTELAQTADTTWGPFSTQADAISKRVGLIRAGKCLPF